MLSNTKQSGFSLLELMIVFALIGMLGAFVVPNLFRARQGAQRKQFLTSLEMMLNETVLRSIVRQEVHQIFFDVKNEVVQIRVHDASSNDFNVHKRFSEVQDSEYRTHIPFLKKFRIKNFFINGTDEVKPGEALDDVLFYIMPDGTSQVVIINFIDENDDEMQDVNFSCVINPFYARMSVHETFQTP